MRIKIFLAIVVTLSLILSGCADQPTSPQLVQEKLALILTQSALQAAQPTPTQQPGLLFPTETPQPPPSAPVTGVSAPGEPKPDARINITAIQQIGPGQAIVNFDAIGEFPSGFNVVWTKELKRPVSPQDDGAYESDPYSRAAMFSGEPGYVYIVRVCRYIGDGCDVYSDPAFFNFRRYAPTPTPNRTATARALNPVVSGGGGGGGGGGTSATAAPKFAIISITDAGGLKARMVWTSDTDPARGFRIYYSTSNKEPKEGSDSYFSIADDDERQAYVDGKAGTTYYYRVCKFTGSGCSEYTAAFSHTYPGTAAKPPPTKVPATPDAATILIATIEDDSDPGTAKIYWGASGSFPEGFKVLFSATNDKPTTADVFVDAPEGATSADVTGIPNTQYYFRVCKVLAGTCTVYSPVKLFTFKPPPEDGAFVLNAVASATQGQVDLSWTAPSVTFDGYSLMYDYPDNPVYPSDLKSGSIDPGDTSYEVTGLTSGDELYFRLCANKGSICVAYSTIPALVTVP